MRISSPPTAWPCYYGIDTPTRAELIASSHSVEDINRYITSDSLAYLSQARMISAVTRASVAAKAAQAAGELAADGNGNGRGHRSLPVVGQGLGPDSFCHACWSGEYPIRFTPHPRQRQMRLLDA
jgi:amidophosphoribosyltransferase